MKKRAAAGLLVRPLRDARDVYSLCLGRVLAHHRAAAGLTQGQLAAAAHLSQPTLSRIERGESQPDARQLRALARALQLAQAPLLAEVDEIEALAERAARVLLPAKTAGAWWQAALRQLGPLGLGGLCVAAAAARLGPALTLAPPE